MALKLEQKVTLAYSATNGDGEKEANTTTPASASSLGVAKTNQRATNGKTSMSNGASAATPGQAGNPNTGAHIN